MSFPTGWIFLVITILWYLLAFNAFRFTGILQWIKKRVKDGNNAGHNAVHVGDLAESVSNLGKKLFEEAI